MGKTTQKGQGNGGGWPSTTGNKSGGGRSNKSGGGRSNNSSSGKGSSKDGGKSSGGGKNAS